ncbi:MAG: hypothetical protein IPK14_05120 [Blastocatellia bacterium]|nr:hypothetical protein [Blastocatellia bacterium]MBL8194265.1 hypothetical protein [Blastocatellia bacterium]MBN8723267.1 hypothetical protein [Acidobacteriota bacterium]
MSHDLIIRLTDEQWKEAQRAVDSEFDSTLIRLGSGDIYYQREEGKVVLIINFQHRAPLGKTNSNE